MVTLADEVEIPSDEENTNTLRHPKDSSNDSDPYEDSSCDEDSFYQFAWGSDSEETNTRPPDKQKQTVSSQVGNSPEIDKSVSEKTSTIEPTQDLEAQKITDQCSLMEMSEDERNYFEQKRMTVNDEQLLRCTRCSNQLFLSNSGNIRIHPALGVLLCQGCHEFYSSGGPFVQDSNGIDEHCRWCAQGGQIICCDTCSYVFCRGCLRKCLTRHQLYEIQKPGFKWSCLFCNKKPIWPQRALSRNVLEAVQKGKEKRSLRHLQRRLTAGQSNDPSIWLPAIITEAEELSRYCKSEARKAQNIWLKEVAGKNQTGGSSSKDEDASKQKVIECCRKLRKAVLTTRFGMKLLEKKMQTRYAKMYGNVDDINVKPQTSNSTAASVGDNLHHDISTDKRIPLLKIKNFRCTDEGTVKRKKDFYAEIRGSSLQTPPGSLSTTNKKQSNKSLMEIKSKSQSSSLVEDSNADGITECIFDAFSEVPNENPDVEIEVACENQLFAKSENDEQDPFAGLDLRPLEESPEPMKEEMRDLYNHQGPNVAQLKSSVNISTRSEPNSDLSNHGDDGSKENMDENDEARMLLLRSDDEDSNSDSNDEIFERVKAPPSKERFAEAPLTLDDPKLKANCEVLVNRLSKAEEAGKIISKKKKTHLLSKIRLIEKTALKTKPSDFDIDSKNEGGFSIVSCKQKSIKAQPARKPFGPEDSDSSDFEEESRDVPNISIPKASIFDQEEAARLNLLASSSSDEETEVEEKKVRKEKLEEESAFVEVSVVDENTTISAAENGATDPILIDVSEDIKEMKPDKVEAMQLLKTNLKLTETTTSSGPKKESEQEDTDPKKKKTTLKEKKAKKLRIQSDSDFETETESENQKKRKKGKQSTSDKDDSDTESKPKRRRRIKKTAVSSSEGDSDDSDIQVLNESQKSEAGASKGRKNIKKIIKDQNLKEETKAAAKEEEARRKRILERQNKYNEAFVGDLAIMTARIDHLVLDFDPKTKEELVTVHKDIVKQLKPHQVKGIKFMWDACFESVERLKTHPGSGCILAHCMGLGKSLQVVTLAHTVLTHEICQVSRVMVVCPLSTVLNWVNEFTRWLPGDLELEVYELTNTKAMDLRASTLRNWAEEGGVLIMGYDMYRNLCNETNKKIKSKIRETFQKALVNPGPDLVICDEGHMLKNESTALSKSMNRIRTQRRIVLTGTPLQNRLDEYHCMIQFVKPNLLGTKKEFTNRFANPIKNGQAADSTESDVKVMKRRAHVLHKMLEGSVQRFDYSVLTPFLPPKHEFVISVRMSDIQIKMYQHYLDNFAKGGPSNAGIRGKGAGLFADFQELGRVWTHPKALLMAQINRDLKAIAQSDDEDLNDFIVDDRSTPLSDDGVVLLDESGDEKEPENNERNGWRSRTRAGRGDAPPPEDELGVTAPISGSWWSSFVTDDDMSKIEHSGKLVLLMDILRQCELIGDKVLVFSQSLVSLDLIEEFLVLEEKKNEEARAALSQTSTGKIEQAVTWRKNADYFRLDGSTNTELRSSWTKSFNNPDNLRSRLFLISTKAGGLGINLTAANRVIIFDASWNPSHDVQSIFRVYRFGQIKPCYVYRFLAQGTMEEKIYDRQVTKLSLSCRVVDEQQIERHFNSADLNELYIFEPDSHLRRPTPMVPKDRLLAELTIQRKDWIVTYHEHDSLLENKSDEELTEAERKAAWDDFENEKRGVPNFMAHDPTGYLGGGLMPGMPDILGSLAGRSVAGIPLSSIAAMIYNSNPGITQDEFLGRLRLTVDQLQSFSVQQVAAAAAAAAIPPLSAPNPVQQQVDAQRMLMQRQMASEQLKRQFGNGIPQSTLAAGPSGISTPPRARGRPPIGPHQRTDLYGLGSVLAAQTPPGGSSSVPNPEANSSSKM